eukprot:15345287-Ditylum_brightwellii.AAC.1
MPSLPALNDISSEQAKPTENTNKSVDFNATYLVQAGAKSHCAGHFYCASLPNPLNYNQAPQNDAVHMEYKTLRNVIGSAADAKCGGLFHNTQMAVVIRNMLIDMGHPPEPTKVKTDNSTTNSFARASMQVKHSKSWDMRWYWLPEATTCKSIEIFWDKGSNNDGDYFTKYHVPPHHRFQRPLYILKGYNIFQPVHDSPSDKGVLD